MRSPAVLGFRALQTTRPNWLPGEELLVTPASKLGTRSKALTEFARQAREAARNLALLSGADGDLAARAEADIGITSTTRSRLIDAGSAKIPGQRCSITSKASRPRCRR